MTDTATRRFEQALWYAYGQIDANHSNGTPLVINATAFAEYARAQATEEDTYLPSIMEQWEAYST